MGVVRRRMTHGAGPAERPRTPGGEAQHTATDDICAGVRAVSRRCVDSAVELSDHDQCHRLLTLRTTL